MKIVDDGIAVIFSGRELQLIQDVMYHLESDDPDINFTAAGIHNTVASYWGDEGGPQSVIPATKGESLNVVAGPNWRFTKCDTGCEVLG